MQPNQQNQDQNQSPQPAAMPYQVPDYLGLAPVVDPAIAVQKKKKKLLILAITVLAMVIFAVGGVLVSAYLQQNNPQQRLYRALEKQLQTSYVDRTYNVKDMTYGITSSYKVETDLADPLNPKSHRAYTETGPIKKTQSSSGTDTSYNISTEETMVDSATLYYQYTNATTVNAVPTNVVRAKWYKYDLNASQNGIEYNLDGADDLQRLNSPQGLIVTGNFNDIQRIQLVNFIKEKDTYQVLASETSSLNNSPATLYTIKIDRSKINELNSKVAQLLDTSSLSKLSSAQPVSESLKLWIDNKTDRLVKIAYTTGKSSEDVSYEKDIAITYPSAVSIVKPSDADSATANK